MDNKEIFEEIARMEKDVVDQAYKLLHFVFNEENMAWKNEHPEKAKSIQKAAHHIIEDCSIILLTMQILKAEMVK